MIMKIRDDFSLRQVGDEYILVIHEAGVSNYAKAITMNETTAFLIRESIGREFTPELWVDLLLDKYDVTPEQAQEDVAKLIAQIGETGLFY